MNCKCLEEAEKKMEENPKFFKLKKGETLEKVSFLNEVAMFGENSIYYNLALPMEAKIKKPDGTIRKTKFERYVMTCCPVCGTPINPDKEKPD